MPRTKSTNTVKTEQEKPLEYSLGVDMKTISNSEGIISVYENRSFTPQGDLKGYDVNQILKNKQEHIYKIFELCNYYADADPIYGNAIKKILVPFSISNGWKLHGASEKVKEKFANYFEDVGIFDLLKDIFYDLSLYENCYIYDRGDWFDILPPHRIKISSIAKNGEPVLEYCITELTNRRYTMAKEGFIDSLKAKYAAYPPEVLDAIDKGVPYVQLNPDNCYTLQGQKSRWETYCIPFISSCLKAFNKKNLISNYEDSLLNIGAKNILHVQVGDKDVIKTVNTNELTQVGEIFKQALNNFPLAVTSWNIQATPISFDTKSMFDKSKYDEVNKEILSACGLSAIIVTGDSSSSNFASATVNVSVAEKKITANQKNVAEFLKKIMKKRAKEWRISDSKVPDFIFNKVSIQDDQAMKDEILKLFQSGLLSYKTTISSLGHDYEQEKERKSKEQTDGDKDIFEVPPSFNTQSANDDKGGRPEDNSGKVDKGKSASGKQPKPSTA